MKNFSLIPVLLVLSACQTATPLGIMPPTAGDVRPNELVVRFKSATDDVARAALRASHQATNVVSIGADAERWVLGDAAATAGTLALLGQDARVQFAQPNGLRRLNYTPGAATPEALTLPRFVLDLAPEPAMPRRIAATFSDPDYAKQWHLPRAKFPAAWDKTIGKGVIVAVIDSGVDPDHPDLKANLLPIIDEVVAMNNHDVLNQENYDNRDGHGHGTHVCGIVGAVNDNQIGITGAAPGVKILPVKVTTSSGDADDATISRGINDAVDNGAQVINLSIGGPEPSPILLEALNYAFNKNVAVVIASGNDGHSVNYPAAYDGVISVGAITPKDKIASYSSHGLQIVMVAPGGGPPGRGEGDPIYSTTPTYPCYITLFDRKSNNYGNLAGTSMAAPQVTAAAALLLSQEPGLTPAQMRTRLAASADDGGEPGYDEYYGFGVLNMERALFYRADDGRKQ